MKAKKTMLSHTDVAKAIQKFKKEGGLIKRLPDQVVPKGVMVGGKFSMFESVFEPSTAGSGGGGSGAKEEAAAE